MTVSTRRAALGAILAAPLASVPAVALTATVRSDLPDDEARFLALAPRMIALLNEYDRLWLLKDEPYAAWEKARLKVHGRKWKHQSENLPEWHAYIAARRPADAIDSVLEELYEPFAHVRFVSFEAIMLRHRYGMTFSWAEDDALDDMTALWRARACA
ncbi:hypothetical protein [Methylobacterium sp. J-070]|uniref:hypothetical protein n=1 Tax=Methylobacterium sp. J-070 TaxID=2836650 RepID=UPI001FBAC75A|nr:hypothetical protein [Methylobacterium sp. J-070]MCJ2053929.1 hypothetical protein [Methylobacterium sp. J-070]